MKLSPETISIIKNFGSMNQNIWVNPGQKLATISTSKTTFASAMVEEEFEQAFGIYDIGKFLGVLSLFNDPEIEFEEKYMRIGEGKNKVRYVYADQEALFIPPEKQIKFANPEINLKVTQDNVARMLKAASVLGATHISIQGDGETVELVAHTIDTNTGKPVSNSDEYRIAVGTTDLNYRMDIKTENFKMLPGDYEVSIMSTKRIAKFVNEAMKLEYFLGCEASSVSA